MDRSQAQAYGTAIVRALVVAGGYGFSALSRTLKRRIISGRLRILKWVTEVCGAYQCATFFAWYTRKN
jgi:hypothetical protein